MSHGDPLLSFLSDLMVTQPRALALVPATRRIVLGGTPADLVGITSHVVTPAPSTTFVPMSQATIALADGAAHSGGCSWYLSAQHGLAVRKNLYHGLDLPFSSDTDLARTSPSITLAGAGPEPVSEFRVGRMTVFGRARAIMGTTSFATSQRESGSHRTMAHTTQTHTVTTTASMLGPSAGGILMLSEKKRGDRRAVARREPRIPHRALRKRIAAVAERWRHFISLVAPLATP
jgi:hypothetical protein